MAAKVEKIAMPRRQTEVIEGETVTTKSKLCNILKINDYGDFESIPVFVMFLLLFSPDMSISHYGCKSGKNRQPHPSSQADRGHRVLKCHLKVLLCNMLKKLF
jgi:hypothetical protein